MGEVAWLHFRVAEREQNYSRLKGRGSSWSSVKVFFRHKKYRMAEEGVEEELEK